MRMRPFLRRVAVADVRAVAIEPVGLNLPVLGSYSSAEARGKLWFSPPAMMTRPLVSRVAVAFIRGTAIEPVAMNVPVAGSYSSALARLVVPPSLLPPAISTRPSKRSVAESK